jgi:hypothetical protein
MSSGCETRGVAMHNYDIYQEDEEMKCRLRAQVDGDHHQPVIHRPIA